MSGMAQILPTGASLKNQLSHFVRKVRSMEKQMKVPNNELQMMAFNREKIGVLGSSELTGIKRLMIVKMAQMEPKIAPRRIHLEREISAITIRQPKVRNVSDNNTHEA